MSVEDAQDITQEFLRRMLESGNLVRANQAQGKFRTYLLRCLKNLMVDEWRKESRQKRGGSAQVFSLDQHDPEEAYQRELHDELTPEMLFDRRWAETLIDRSIDRLRREWESAGRPFEKMKGFLVEPRGSISLEPLAEDLNTSVGALKSTVHRLRRRYGEIFREEVSHTVADRDEVDGEIRHLLSTLSG